MIRSCYYAILIFFATSAVSIAFPLFHDLADDSAAGPMIIQLDGSREKNLEALGVLRGIDLSIPEPDALKLSPELSLRVILFDNALQLEILEVRERLLILNRKIRTLLDSLAFPGETENENKGDSALFKADLEKLKFQRNEYRLLLNDLLEDSRSPENEEREKKGK